MDYRFEEDKGLDRDVIDVTVRSQSLTPPVQQFLDYLATYQAEAPAIIPIKTADRIEMLRVEDLILVEVNGTSLVLETTRGPFIISDRLYRFQERLSNPDFVQVSKQSLININHLDYLEDAFSGAMTAFLTKKLKTNVSRKYLKDLATRLGL
ncbi:LytTR family DNA-binding domain-containing protein [Streptococcus rifensis]